MEKFSNFFNNGERNLLPKKKKKSHRKNIIWSNLFKSFKDTISKTNTCFRQHHDNAVSKKTFQRKRFRKKWLKAQKSLHMTKFLVICNNPRIASTKTQSIFCNYNVFCERQNSEKTNISWYQIEIFEFSWNKNLFQDS